MASYHLPLFGVCRVGPVYTPPEHRRNGYAGALTAHVTAQILAQGNQACLYTDLANPTSNQLYARIGYVPVADAIDLTFSS
jgi:predicted GNAT family acetyltransferase